MNFSVSPHTRAWLVKHVSCKIAYTVPVVLVLLADIFFVERVVNMLNSLPSVQFTSLSLLNNNYFLNGV